jgi:hypothetical protein
MYNNAVSTAIVMEVMETKERAINCAARNSGWVYPRATPARFAGAPVIFDDRMLTPTPRYLLFTGGLGRGCRTLRGRGRAAARRRVAGSPHLPLRPRHLSY